MKNLCFLSFLVLLIGFSSCSKSNELDVSSEDVQFLQNYVEEANAMVSVAGEIEGNVSAIFNTNVTINLCGGYVQFVDYNGGVADEATELLNEIVDKMGFESALAVHDWMVEAGRVVYDIKQANKKNFDTDRDMMTELACLSAPEIMTRNSSSECYKKQLIGLFIGTLTAGDNYATKFASQGKKEIDLTNCSARGSSFNKIWSFMKNTYDCE
ncbi:MAG: hypothetical protein P1U56_03775 [Saprospiraceae bacterium]|nr:hypothetical protein [Saprospiraceae bacterium]